MKSREPLHPNTPPSPTVSQNIESSQGNGAEPPPSLKREPDPTFAITEPAAEPLKSRFQQIENEVGLGKRESIFRNLDALKILPDEDDDDTSEEVLTGMPIRRPGKRALRTHPDDKYQFEAFILEDVKDKVSYFIIPPLGKVLIDQDIENIKHVILVLCINKSGKMFFWPIPAKGNFRSSGLAAVGLARDFWIKAVGDLESGGYRTRKMLQSEYEEPAWPALMPSIEDLLELAFHDNIIDIPDHPAIKSARDV